MAKSRVVIRGSAALVSNLKAVTIRYKGASKRAIAAEAERLKSIVIPLTPKAPGGGTLRGDFFTNTPIVGISGPRVTVGFAGPSDAYSVAQHEGPGSAEAPPSWAGKSRLDYSFAGTGPKFLEKGLQELRKEMLANLRKFIAADVAKLTLRR